MDIDLKCNYGSGNIGYVNHYDSVRYILQVMDISMDGYAKGQADEISFGTDEHRAQYHKLFLCNQIGVAHSIHNNIIPLRVS